MPANYNTRPSSHSTTPAGQVGLQSVASPVDNLVTTRRVIQILASGRNSVGRAAATAIHLAGKLISNEGDWESCPQSFPHLWTTRVAPHFEVIFIAWRRKQPTTASSFALLSERILSTSMIVWKNVSEKTENPLAWTHTEGWQLCVSKSLPLHTETWSCRIFSCG